MRCALDNAMQIETMSGDTAVRPHKCGWQGHRFTGGKSLVSAAVQVQAQYSLLAVRSGVCIARTGQSRWGIKEQR